jgi:hypothetical protein
MPIPLQEDTSPSNKSTTAEDDLRLIKDAGFDKNLNSFYKYLAPTEIANKLKFPGQPDPIAADKASMMYSMLQRTYLNATLSGQKIIDNLKDLTDLPERGVGFNTAYIDKSGRGLFLDGDYWTTTKVKPSKSDVGAGQEFAADSFYQNLCSTGGDAPSAAASINVIRMPFLSQARKNTDAVAFFMNYMPPLFANQLVPYFDVEFQFSADVQNVDTVTGKKKQYLSHPSILRFLLGSSVDVEKTAGSLTNVDLALLSNMANPIKGSSPAGAGGVTTAPQITISGMELFTMPQTLTNMDQLKANGEARLLDVKPFLPPATLTNAGITVLNSGLNTPSRKASLEFKLFDRSRLIEFSDFIRGPTGYKDLVVWITFGWLAPRGRGSDDAYAKFVNENMLVRYAFMVLNSSFSFDATGTVTLKLELITKSVANLEQSRIDTTGTKMQEALKRVSGVLREIHKRRSSYKNKAAEAQQNLGANKEIRIFQILDAAEAGNLDLNIDPGVVNDTIKDEIKRLKAENPIDQKSLDLMLFIRELYEIDPDSKKPKYKMEMEKLAKDYANEKFKSLENSDEDPFLPRPGKKGQYRFFSDDLIQAMKDVGAEPAPADAKGSPAKNAKSGTGSGGKGGGGGGGGKGGGNAPKKDRRTAEQRCTGSGGVYNAFTNMCDCPCGKFISPSGECVDPDQAQKPPGSEYGPPPPPPVETPLITPSIPEYTPPPYDPTSDPIA